MDFSPWIVGALGALGMLVTLWQPSGNKLKSVIFAAFIVLTVVAIYAQTRATSKADEATKKAQSQLDAMAQGRQRVRIEVTDQDRYCPHPLPFTESEGQLKREFGTVAKHVEIASAEPFYRARIYTTAVLERASILKVAPDGGSAAATSGPDMGLTFTDLIFNPTPKTAVTVGLYSSEPIRVICVERVN